MTDQLPDDADEPIEGSTETTTAPVAAPYKVLGEFDAEDGVAVLGQNDADTGTPVGVRGAVPNASDGYGLATDDDVRIEGAIDTATADFAVEAGTTATGDAANVIHGHASNTATSGVVGGVVGGGGYDDGNTTQANEVAEDYGTVVGGLDNTASGNKAFVGGGEKNDATDFNAVVAGGFDNAAEDPATVVGGGAFNDVTARRGTIAGGVDNEVTAEKATVGGGGYNAARGEWSTIAGGGPTDTGNPGATSNVVFDGYGTIGGGGDNQVGRFDSSSQPFATVSGGRSNFAGAAYATVGGGTSNAAESVRATVPGGEGNTASGQYSFAAGRGAEAAHQGAFVWSDSGSGSFSSTSADQFLVDAAGGVGIGTDSPETKLDVDGAVSESKVGVNAYLSSNQSVSNGTATRVEFDAERNDDFGGFDTATGVYTVQTAGDYHVDFLIDWTEFDSNDLALNEEFVVEYFLLINGSENRGLNTEVTVAENDFAAHGYGKTVFGLSPGDTIEVVVGQTSERSQSIEGSNSGPTYLTVHKVG